MNRRTLLQSLPAAALLPTAARAAAAAHGSTLLEDSTSPQSSTTVYELRVYHTYEGKLDDLLRRFREHTMQLFEKHGIRNVAYWTPTDDPLKGKTLFYIIAHPSREAATANWQAFRDDPEWKSVQAKSEANGKLVEKVDSTFLTLTDFSPPVR
jgi:NIPSNAP